MKTHFIVNGKAHEETVYESEATSSHPDYLSASLASCVAWALRKGAEVVTITRLPE
jgi:uncharacterized OsmC-like protein